MPNRDHWSSSFGFVLAAAGSAIGLGNLWKFPYITYRNDGGAFVLVYLGCILVVGLPIMIAEIMIGRKAQTSPVGAMRAVCGRAWAPVGGLGVVSGFVLLGFYALVAGWSLRSFVQCINWSTSGFDPTLDLAADFGGMASNGGLQALLGLLFMGLTTAVVASGVRNGIERVARLLLPILFGILALLLINSFRMSGSSEALTFIFRPDFARLEGRGVLEALGHAFFTLSLGMGAMITYGSYMSKKDSVVKAAATVVLLDTLIALFATIIMFTVIFSHPGIREQIGGSTAGMLFITLPPLFYTGVPLGEVLAPLFYVLVAFAALTSTVSLLEVVVSYFIDQRGMTRHGASLMCGGAIYGLTILCGISLGAVGGISNFEIFEGKAGLFNTLDHLVANWFLPVGGLLTTIAAGWFIPKLVSKAELTDEKTRFFKYEAWSFFVRFVSPLAVGTILFFVIFKGADFS
jgi:neurotransmitter:Na+ symporter, NSS family